MIIKFNPTATQVRKGHLVIRLDFYPEPADQTYVIHHVNVVDETSQAWLKGYKGKLDDEGNPVDQVAYDAWIAGLPHIWRVNPCLCKTVTIPTTLNTIGLTTLLQTLNKTTLATLDDTLQKEYGAWLVGDQIAQKTHQLDRESLLNTRIPFAAKVPEEIKDSEKVDGVLVHDPIVATINTRLASFEVKV